MSTISFPVPSCYDQAPSLQPLERVLIECLDVADLSPSDLKAGGRTAIVQVYPKSAKCCSGQYGTFQVLNGLGGQIKNALYVGKSAEAFGTTGLASAGGPEIDLPAIDVPVDCSDSMTGDDKGIAIRDRGRWYVVKLGVGGAVEDSDSGMVVGVVLGGNVSPKSFKAEPELQQPTQRSAPPDENTTEDEYGYKGSDYPNRRPFAFPLPEIDVAGNKLGAPLVNDWRRYDLAASYKVGDKLPRVPDGLCYVRIERPYSVEDAAWDADDVGAPPRPGVGAQEPVKAVRNGSNVSVWFRHAANEAANGSTWELAAAFNPTNYSAPNYSAQLAQAFPITQDGVAVILAGGATLVVSWLSFVTTGCATVTLGRRAGSNISGITASDLELLNTLTAVQLTVPAGFLVAGVLASAGGNLILRTGLAKETVMRCLNDSSTQSFRAGDLVYVQKTPLAMQDRYGLVNNGVNQSRKVHRLIGGISGIKNNVIS